MEKNILCARYLRKRRVCEDDIFGGEIFSRIHF